MNTKHTLAAFLRYHGFESEGIDVNSLIAALLDDMERGLAASGGNIPEEGTFGGHMEMIPTWSLPPREMPRNRTVAAIDAGGTNFRSCLVTFGDAGMPVITDMRRAPMPGSNGELSRQAFFSALAANLDHLKNRTDRIGFCFSYPMEITADGDGRVITFTKEIQAKEVIGTLVGRELGAALQDRGWDVPEKIVLLNDTVAALLAGAAEGGVSKTGGSYVGLILGTGFNAAYIESAPISKLGGAAPQIIVCESGKFNKLPWSDFDREMDAKTLLPGAYRFEKMCAGAYLGALGTQAVRQASSEGLFSSAVTGKLCAADFGLKDMDGFLHDPRRRDTVLGALAAEGTGDDRALLAGLLDAFVDRSARLAAGIIAAAVIRCGQGADPAAPVRVVCEGTTFAKTWRLKERVRAWLDAVLTRERGLYVEVVEIDNAISLGAAVAGTAN
ncbi:MAG: hexokinase [Spirochaetaceae bacterium]|nr:hexokinase [Spirochaetaceae bacterium]